METKPDTSEIKHFSEKIEIKVLKSIEIKTLRDQLGIRKIKDNFNIEQMS